jgi:hypothetical protein
MGGVIERGVVFNGVRFDALAPTQAILGAYTLAHLMMPVDILMSFFPLSAGVDV